MSSSRQKPIEPVAEAIERDNERPHWREPAEAARVYTERCTALGHALVMSRWKPKSGKAMPAGLVQKIAQVRVLLKRAARLEREWQAKMKRQEYAKAAERIPATTGDAVGGEARRVVRRVGKWGC